MKKDINKVFNLQGFLCDSIWNDDKNQIVFIKVRGPRKFVSCPNCSSSIKNVHQIKYREVKHGLVDLKIVILVVKTRRFKCKHCGKVFTEQLPGISRQKTSFNFRLQLFEWLKTNSFRWVSQKFNIAPSTLVRYLLEFNKDIGNIDWERGNIRKLGIDEHSFRGRRMVITITDLKNKKLLTILKGDDQKTLEKFFKKIPEKYRLNIDEVCTDLRESYGVVIKKYLPNAIYTADRYHVETLARVMVDEIRRIIQEERPGRKMNTKKLLWRNKYDLDANELRKLEIIFEKYKNYPVLKQSWLIKEKIVQMYQIKNQEEAERKFNEIIMLLETTDYSGYLSTFRRTFKRWRVPILNYFKNRTTNGFTEGCHTKIKMIKRVSYGFRNINNYIAKITLAFLPFALVVSYHTF